jgi:hypothetical protein
MTDTHPPNAVHFTPEEQNFLVRFFRRALNDLRHEFRAKVSFHSDRRFGAKLSPIIRFGVRQGHLSPVIPPPHGN